MTGHEPDGRREKEAGRVISRTVAERREEAFMALMTMCKKRR